MGKQFITCSCTVRIISTVVPLPLPLWSLLRVFQGYFVAWLRQGWLPSFIVVKVFESSFPLQFFGLFERRENNRILGRLIRVPLGVTTWAPPRESSTTLGQAISSMIGMIPYITAFLKWGSHVVSTLEGILKFNVDCALEENWSGRHRHSAS